MGTNWSHYQTAIFDFVKTGRGHGLVGAVAGSGKTTTITEAAKIAGGRSLFVAFNKHIAEALRAKLNGAAEAKTLHAVGLQTLSQFLPNLRVEAGKYRKITRAISHQHKLRPEQWPALMKLVDFTRLTLTALHQEEVFKMAHDYGLDYSESLFAPLEDALKAGVDAAEREGAIDFTDMIWLVHQYHLKPEAYDFVFVDECLPYQTPVQLADGSALPIGEIVEKQLSVKVLAYDTRTGKQKACKVIGWSKTLNRKPLVKIKVRWSERKGTNRPTNFVVCTIDHKVWANGQWMEAGGVRPGMTMQVETSAIKSQAGKIAGPGRETLSAGMRQKNAAARLAGRQLGKPGVITRRGGNGKGPTLAQSVLLEALGADWLPEHAVKTGGGDGYPNHYKLDIANPARMIAVEVDGGSHKSPLGRERDAKKDALLQSLGWKVYRFSNREAIQQTDECVRQINSCVGDDCPIDAEVISVDLVSIPDAHVYDITVENCHNFYANGILVHNCQDLNAAQRELALSLSHGRLLFVGDRRQAIMGFAGADANSYDAIGSVTQAAHLPLSICYRCPRSHLIMARDIVPEIEAAPGAEVGVLDDVDEDFFRANVAEGDLVICRRNAPLLKHCLALIAQGKAARVRGREIGKQLADTVRAIGKLRSWERFVEGAEFWAEGQQQKLKAQDAPPERIQQVFDELECVLTCFSSFRAHCSSADELALEIEGLFADDNAAIWLSSIHRAKGLEADRVFILEAQRLGQGWRGMKPRELEQERNLRYVALTRAKKELYLVTSS